MASSDDDDDKDFLGVVIHPVSLDTLFIRSKSVMSKHLHTLSKDGDVLKFMRQFQLSNVSIGIPPLILIHLLHKPPCAASVSINGPQLYGAAVYHDSLCECDNFTAHVTHSARIVQCIQTGCNMQTVYESGHYAVIAAYMQFFGVYRTFCPQDDEQLRILFTKLLENIRTACQFLVPNDQVVIIIDVSEYTALSALTKMQLLIMFVSFELFAPKMETVFQDNALQRAWLPFVLMRILGRCDMGEKYPVFSTVIKESLAQGRMMPRNCVLLLLIVLYDYKTLSDVIDWLPEYKVVTIDDSLIHFIEMCTTLCEYRDISLSSRAVELNIVQYSNNKVLLDNVAQSASYALILDCETTDTNIQRCIACSEKFVWLHNTIPAAVEGEVLLHSLLCFFPPSHICLDNDGQQ